MQAGVGKSGGGRRRGALLAIGCLAAALSLQGCRADEQDRILRFQKGTYLGPADTPPRAADEQKLVQRTGTQKF